MNRKTRSRLAARKKASRPDRFIEDGYSHWKFSKGKATSASSESKIENIEISAEEISQLINYGELDVNAICRDWHGRFASCGAAGLPPSERSGVSEARMVHARHLVEQVRGAKTPDPAAVKQLADHLGTLTVAQLHSLKKEYGLSASGNKAALKEKLTTRFSQKAGTVSPTAAAPTVAPKATGVTSTASSPPSEPVHVPVGTFGTPKDVTWHTNEKSAHAAAREFLGSGATAHDLLAIAGTPDGSHVTVDVNRRHDGVDILINARGNKDGAEFGAIRTLRIRNSGKTIHNDQFDGEGSGLSMFGRQVENATKWGFSHIETHAAGLGSGTPGQRPPKGSYNGYYTWPRFGYNSKLHPDDIERMPPDVQRNAKAAGNMLSGVMSTKEGREWWMGDGYSMNMKFDLTPGSYSQDTLSTYLRHRGVLK